MTAALKIRDGTNTLRTITVLKVRDASNTLRTITEIWVRDTNNVPRLVFNPSGSATLACALDTTAVSGFSAGTGTATTGTCTASGSGGTGPYTYAWNLVSYTLVAFPPTANSASSAASTFTQTGIDPNTTESAIWTCTVTDSLSNTATSEELTSYFSDIS